MPLARAAGRASESQDLVAIKHFLGGRSIAVVHSDLNLISTSDDLKEDLSVLWIVTPAAGLGCPNHAVALDLASIIPNEIVDRPDIAQEQNIAIDPCDLDKLGVATHERCNRRAANHFGRKRRRGEGDPQRKASGENHGWHNS
jgi:hypothetical protein